MIAIRAYERIIKPIKITDATADTFSLFRVKRLAETSRRGLPVSPGTVNVELGCLSAAMTKAVEWGYLRDHPMRFIEKYKIPEKSRRALTRKETRLSIEASKQSESGDAFDMMMFFLLTGVRLEELTYLPWTHVDLKAKTFKIGAWDSDKIKDWPKGWRVIKWSSKNSQTRKNPLDQRLIPILKRRFKRKDSPLVFAGRGGPRGPFRLGELFARIFRRADVEGVTIHSLRHTFGTRMAESGCDVATLQKLMGHADVRTTMGYFTSEMDHKKKQQQKLSLT
jgi:integrase